jgi:hypothetical protein
MQRVVSMKKEPEGVPAHVRGALSASAITFPPLQFVLKKGLRKTLNLSGR